MKNRKAEAVKKRIAERKKVVLQNKKWKTEHEPIEKNDIAYLERAESSKDYFNMDQVNSPEPNSSDPNSPDPNKPGLKNPTFSDWFLFRSLLSMIFVLVIAIIFRSTNPTLNSFKTIIGNSFKRDYQFAKISNWTSKTMGDMFSFSPMEFFKTNDGLNQTNDVIPVSGKVIESFKKNGKGITVETNRDKTIIAIQDGIVIFAGNDNNHGKTVIVQQSNGMNVWYGNLGSIKVNLYQHIASGDGLGIVMNNSTSNHGEYYFAVEKDNKFLNPSKVISFE